MEYRIVIDGQVIQTFNNEPQQDYGYTPIIVVLIISILVVLAVNSNNQKNTINEQFKWESVDDSKFVWRSVKSYPQWQSTSKNFVWKSISSNTISNVSYSGNGANYTMKNEGAKIRRGRFMCYKDSRGFLTCGIGICVDSRCGGIRKLTITWKGKRYTPDRCWRRCGISKQHARAAFLYHYQSMINELSSRTTWFNKLNTNQKTVIIDMAFNMGKGIFIKGYKKYWSTTVNILKSGQYRRFTQLFKGYPYCRQVGNRCHRNARLFLS